MISEYALSPLSKVDDIGQVLISNDKVLRGIYPGKEDEINELFSSGLLNELMKKGLLVQTHIAKVEITGYSLVLEHEKIGPEIYPFEWSPEMLRKAAVCIININICANGYGYELKDAHPYNVMFKGTQPVFIDIGSFEKIYNKNFWRAYDEFLTSFYYPLKFYERGLTDIYKRSHLLNGVGITRVQAKMILNPFYSLAGKKLAIFIDKGIYLYSKIRTASFTQIRKKIPNYLLASIVFGASKINFLPFSSSSQRRILKKVNGISIKSSSVWGSYHETAGFYSTSGSIALSPRMKSVVEIVRKLEPKSVLELAGNQGVLSLALSDISGINSVVCTDYDEVAVDAFVKLQKTTDVGVACFDFIGEAWQSLSNERYERLKSDVVIALAVTHHLILTQNYSPDVIFKALSGYTNKYLIVEFMPLGLWAGGDVLPILPDWYSENWFVNQMLKHFELVDRIELERNRIAFVVKKI